MLTKEEGEWSQQSEWRIVSFQTNGEGFLIDAPEPTAIYMGEKASVELRKQVEDIISKKTRKISITDTL